MPGVCPPSVRSSTPLVAVLALAPIGASVPIKSPAARHIGQEGPTGSDVVGPADRASSASGTSSGSTRGTAGRPLPAPTRAKVEQVVRQFQDTNQTPGVLVGIWSPQGNLRRGDRRLRSRDRGAARAGHAVQDRQPDQDVHGQPRPAARRRGQGVARRPHLQVGGGRAQRRPDHDPTAPQPHERSRRRLHRRRRSKGRCSPAAPWTSCSPRRRSSRRSRRRREVVVQQLRLQPARAGRGAGRRART